MGALGILVVEGIEEQLGDWLVEPGASRLAMLNVAPSQLTDPEFIKMLEALSEHDELAGHFGIELSASAALGNLSHIAALAERLAPNLAIGADGWSDLDIPLTALSDAGFGYLKLHRNLVTQLPSDQMLRDRATRLVNESIERNINVYAIGVEKETEVEALEQIGCCAAQGFLFSAAVSASEFLREVSGVPARGS